MVEDVAVDDEGPRRSLAWALIETAWCIFTPAILAHHVMSRRRR